MLTQLKNNIATAAGRSARPKWANPHDCYSRGFGRMCLALRVVARILSNGMGQGLRFWGGGVASLRAGKAGSSTSGMIRFGEPSRCARNDNRCLVQNLAELRSADSRGRLSPHFQCLHFDHPGRSFRLRMAWISIFSLSSGD
jgi:hypothetical protein